MKETNLREMKEDHRYMVKAVERDKDKLASLKKDLIFYKAELIIHMDRRDDLAKTIAMLEEVGAQG